MNDEQQAPQSTTPTDQSALSTDTNVDTEANTDTVPGPLCEDSVREELKKVIDPELFINIIDLGLIYTVDFEPGEDEKQNVKIDMTLTSPACPAGPQLIAQSKMMVKQMEGVADVEVRIVMDPPWSPEKMTEDARDQLGIF